MTADCWSLLGISPTEDESVIRKAYARRLRDFRPDEDPVGFQALVEARKAALLETEWRAKRQGRELADDDEDFKYEVDEKLRSSISVKDQHDLTPDRYASAAPHEPNQLTRLITSLDLLVNTLRPVVTEAPASRLWVADPWTKLFDQAANELDLESHDAFLQVVATKVDCLFPPYDRKYLTSLAAYGEGKGIAAVANVIEQHARFSERGPFLFNHCSRSSAYNYLGWVGVARAGRNILDRLAEGKTAYFRESIPIFPAHEEPNEVDGSNLSRYYRHALELGRWPMSFKLTKFFLPSYAVARSFHRPLGLLMILLTLAAFIFSFMAKTSTVLYVTTAFLCPLIAVRIYFAAQFKKFHILRLAKRTISADKYRIWDPLLRFAYQNSNISWKSDPLSRASMPVELFIVVIILINVFVSYAAIWREGPLYAKPAEQIVVDTVLFALDRSTKSPDFYYSHFFDVFSQIRSGDADGFPLRVLGGGVTAGELPNKLWLPQLMGARRRLEASLTSQQQFDERLLGVHENRDKKLKALYFLYQAGDPTLRVSIEETLLLFTGVMHPPYDEESANWQRTLWKIIPPRQPYELSPSEVELFHSKVLQLFISIVGTRTSNISETQILTQLRFLLSAKGSDLIAKISLKEFKPIPDDGLSQIIIPDTNLPSERLLRALLKGHIPDIGHHGMFQGVRGVTLPSEIAHIQSIDVSTARKVYFETASSLSSGGSPAFVLDVLNASLADIPSRFHPGTADFWISGAINLVKAATENAEFDPTKRYYFTTENEDVKILARQIIEGRF